MILIMGPAGSGKSVQAEKLVSNYNFTWLSTGVILRAKLNDPAVRERMEQGELLSNEMVQDYVGEALDEAEDLDMVIVDGFPRNVDQSKWMSGYLRGRKRDLRGIIHLELDLAVAKQRLLGRGRTDDHEEAIAQRFAEYERSTVPIINYFRNQNIPVFDIEGDQPIDGVHESIRKALGL